MEAKMTSYNIVKMAAYYYKMTAYYYKMSYDNMFSPGQQFSSVGPFHRRLVILSFRLYKTSDESEDLFTISS
jgi:hypothetical protein